jgi:hypothetical protein
VNMVEKLIGKDYPIKDENGNVAFVRKITEVLELDNVAGVVIGLDNRKPSLLISFGTASKLVDGEYYVKE